MTEDAVAARAETQQEAGAACPARVHEGADKIERGMPQLDRALLLTGILGLVLLGFHACGVEPPAICWWLFDTITSAAAHFFRAALWGATHWELWATSACLTLGVSATRGHEATARAGRVRYAAAAYAMFSVHALVGCGVVKGAALAELDWYATTLLVLLCLVLWCFAWMFWLEPTAMVGR